MDANWRHLFYYIFGFLPSVFFGSRFIIQWIKSEKERKSHVNTTFWYLSLFGNFLLALHYFIQVQYPLFLIQTINGFVSWRNINLLSNARKSKTFKLSIMILACTTAFSTLLFFIQVKFISGNVRLLEIPFGLIDQKKPCDIPILWHLFGIFGSFLFGIRFWIQWLEAEKTGKSSLNKNFWLLSITGSAIALTYFLHIGDWVSSINYSCGLIPYIRNLMLIKQERTASST